MKQDINYFLLGLLVLILLSMVGLGLYYQNEYKNLSGEYDSALQNLKEKNDELDKKMEEINQTRSDLDSRESALVDIVKELNLTKEKQVSLGGFYANLTGEKQLLQEDLSATEQDLQKWKTSYTAKDKDLKVCQQDSNLKDQQLAKKDSKISYMQTNIKYASTSLNQTDDNLFSVEKNIEDLKLQITDLYKKVGKMSEPDEIGADAKSGIKGDLDDMQSYIDGKLENSLISLRNSITNAKKGISSAG